MASAALWLATSSARAQIVDLGTLPGGKLASGWGINENGDVAGVSDDTSGCDKPFIVATRGPNAFKMVDLGTFGGCTPAGDWLTMSMAINNHSLVVGHAPNPPNQIRPFAWTEKHGKVDLGTLEGHPDAIPWRVNDNGVIVGENALDIRNGVDNEPVVWLPDKKTKTWHIQKLDTKGFEAYSTWVATSINSSSQIVGETQPVNGFPVAIVWNPLPDGKSWKAMKLEVPQGYTGSFARDINEHGEIVGAVITSEWNALPALWKPLATQSDNDRRGSGWQKAQLLAGLWGNQKTTWIWSVANGLNDEGDIVGQNGYNAGGPDFWLAVSWRIDKPESVLQLFKTSSEAFDVNNNGFATGDYVVEVDGVQQTHAFAIQIPEEDDEDKPKSR
jgi:uncharacterized membrane protein